MSIDTIVSPLKSGQIEDHLSFFFYSSSIPIPSHQSSISSPHPYLGLALRGEVLLDEQGSQGHAKVFVGLGEAEPAQLQLLLGAIYLSRKLVDGAAEGSGQVFT